MWKWNRKGHVWILRTLRKKSVEKCAKKYARTLWKVEWQWMSKVYRHFIWPKNTICNSKIQAKHLWKITPKNWKMKNCLIFIWSFEWYKVLQNMIVKHETFNMHVNYSKLLIKQTEINLKSNCLFLLLLWGHFQNNPLVWACLRPANRPACFYSKIFCTSFEY